MKKNHISPEDLEKLISTLNALPPKPKEALSTRETVSGAEIAIRSALQKGYSFADIVELFAQFRLSVRPGTISGYLADLEPKPAAQKKAEKPKAPKSMAPSKAAALPCISICLRNPRRTTSTRGRRKIPTISII
jgi:hypothetical protein